MSARSNIFFPLSKEREKTDDLHNFARKEIDEVPRRETRSSTVPR